MKNKQHYKIINLVTDDYNKSIVLYGTNDDLFIKKVYNHIVNYIKNNPDEGISKYIFKTPSGNPVIKIERACIDMKVDDYFDEDYLIELLEEI